ncbi:hypothetical protein U0070_007520, partial [Myodes glareolus]
NTRASNSEKSRCRHKPRHSRSESFNQSTELDGADQYHMLSWMGATFPAGYHNTFPKAIRASL